MSRRIPADCSDPPFGCPPDVVLDLPAPPSVNKTRRYDWRNRSSHKDWLEDADKILLANGQSKQRKIPGAYEVHVTVSSTLRGDLDNYLKTSIDYLHRIETVQGDNKKYLRKLTAEWGDVPAGCRLRVREWETAGLLKGEAQ